MRLTALICVIFAGTLRLEPCIVRPTFSYPPAVQQSQQHFPIVESRELSNKLVRGCDPLPSGQTIKSVIRSLPSRCFAVEVRPDEATQLIMDQPEDLEFHVRSSKAEIVIDGFEIENETATLQSPGLYRVEVRKVAPSARTVTFSMSRRPLPLQKAVAWQEAEIWATISKRSGKSEDIERSLKLWTDLGETGSIARTHLKEGLLMWSKPDFGAARAAFEKALELCRSIADPRCAAEAEGDSGAASRRLGDLERAEQRIEEAANDLHGLPNVEMEEAHNRSNLGLLFWESGDFNQAISTHDKARLILSGRSRKGYGIALNNLGLCYQSLGEYEKARLYFKAALIQFARSKSFPDTAKARMNLGRNYMLQGELRRAQTLLAQTLESSVTLKDPPTRADILRNLGQTFWREGKTDEARLRFEEALKIDREDGDRRGESSALHYLGLEAEKAGDISVARDLLQQAFEIRRECGLRDDAAESLFALASLEYNAGKLDAARDRAGEALKLLELVRNQVPGPALQASFYARKRQFFDLLVDIAMAPGTPEADAAGLLAAERGRSRALMDLLAERDLLKQIPADLKKRRDNIQKQLDYLSEILSKPGGSKNAELRERVQRLLAEDEGIQASIRELVSGEKLSQPLTNVTELQRQYLPPDSMVIEYSLGAQHSYMWLIEADRIRAFSLPPAAMIEAEARPAIQWFGEVQERQRSPDKQAAFVRAMKKLSTTLLGNLSGIQLPQRLILVPDGVLYRIPFADLKLPTASEPLGLSYDLVQVPSAAYLTVGRHPLPVAQFPQAILAIVDPVFSANDPRVHRRSRRSNSRLDLPRLVFTYEVPVIQSRTALNRHTILRSFDASRAKVAELPLADFAVLHFSTHAEIDDNIPELSTLVLSMIDRAGWPANGLLLPYELAQFPLNGSIVVLSACDTALGKQMPGEGMAGLTSSLLYAGASQLVVTLTKVDDEASSYFFSRVYSRFLTGSTNMEHSITLARRKMARSGRFSDPYYWAPFVVIGRPTDALDSRKSDSSSSSRRE